MAQLAMQWVYPDVYVRRPPHMMVVPARSSVHLISRLRQTQTRLAAVRASKTWRSRRARASTRGRPTCAQTSAAASPPSHRGTVPKLLADERKNVLRGVEIVFSGVFDHNDKTLTPREHPLWRLAERLGARVVSEPGTSTTHVVAKCVGTDLTHKAMWGLQYLKHVVSPAWVEASAMMWTRQDEGRFPVKRPK